MSVIATVAPSVTPLVSPLVSPAIEVVKTVVVSKTSHFFQLAEIVKFIGLGAGLTILHSVLNGYKNVPKVVNLLLPIAYATITGIAIVLVDNSVNLDDWYQVATQVFSAAGVVYALIYTVNAATNRKSDLPTVNGL
jgi:hypothetical protein